MKGNQALLEFLKEYVPREDILLSEMMNRHTAFRIGGPADIFCKVQSAEALAKILRYLTQTGRDCFIIGKGSNLLVSDKGYRGVILQPDGELAAVRVEGTRIIAGAGASLPQVARTAAEHGLSGLEFAAGIPGSLGGAVVMNAGAYDGEMKQIVKSVTVYDQMGEEMCLDNDTMEFSYRSSIIKDRPFTVAEVTMELQEGDREAIFSRMEELNRRRREKQPLEYPSAGSTFKRPQGYFAGKLIMDAGLRGLRVGDAQVSEKHCGFIVNIGNASAEDVKELMEEVQYRVKKQLGVRLEPEVILLGEF